MAQAVLYVELVPTTTGIKRNVENDLNGAFQSSEKAASSFWGKVAGFGKAAAATLTAAVGVVTGVALKGGFSRLLKIEDATAKLKGLGNSAATVTEIMSDALASVKGTAFGLDAAATIAASAVAAGIKPGQELTKYLKLTADAATIAGTSLGDMGSILNKVTSSGKAYNDSLQQLSDRGIPIYQWLAKELGTTSDAVFKLASEGKVSSEQFNKAISDNISGAALNAGDTTRGAFANMLASLSRVGAGLLSGVFPMFKSAFQGITELMAPLETKAAELGKIIGEQLTPFFEKMSGATAGLGGKLSALAPILAPLLGAFVALGAGALPGLLSKIPILGEMLGGLAGPLKFLGGPLGIILGAIVGLIAVSPQLQSALGGAFEAVFGAISGVVTQLAPVFGQLLPVVAQLASLFAGLLVTALSRLAPFIVGVVAGFGDLLSGILPMLMPLLQTLVTVVGSVLDAIMPLLGSALPPLLTLFQALIPVILSIVNAVLPLVSVLVSALMPVFDALMPILSLVLAALMPLIDVFVQLLGPIMALLSPLIDLITAILTPLMALLGPLITDMLQPLMVAFQLLLPPILEVAKGLGTSLIPIISAVMKILGGLIDFITGVFTGNWSLAWSGIQKIFGGIWDGIVGILKGALNLAIDLINGITRGINVALDAVKDATGGAISLHIGKIPRLAAGGIAQSVPGGGYPAILGDGRYDEAVLPLGGPQLAKIRDAFGIDKPVQPVDSGPTDLSDSTIDKLARAIAAYVRNQGRQGEVAF